MCYNPAVTEDQFNTIIGRLDSMDGRFDSVEAKIEQVDRRINALDGRMTDLRERLVTMEVSFLNEIRDMSRRLGRVEGTAA